jgi:hypothetical protein
MLAYRSNVTQPPPIQRKAPEPVIAGDGINYRPRMLKLRRRPVVQLTKAKPVEVKPPKPPAPPQPPKAKAIKRPAPPTIIEAVVQMISRPEGATGSEILLFLIKRFPDRDSKKLRSTLRTLVANLCSSKRHGPARGGIVYLR